MPGTQTASFRVQRRGSNFFYRRRVPNDLVALLGRTEIVRSLQAANLSEARRHAPVQRAPRPGHRRLRRSPSPLTMSTSWSWPPAPPRAPVRRRSRQTVPPVQGQVPGAGPGAGPGARRVARGGSGYLGLSNSAS